MHSIFVKVLIWSLGTFGLSLVAYWAISRNLEWRGPGAHDPFHRMNAMIEDDVRLAYEQGGPERLAEQLRKLDAYLPGEHFLTDENGRDLVTGADRSELLATRPHSEGPPRLPDGRLILIPPRHGRHRNASPYRYITVIPRWFDPPNILPYYGAIVLGIVGMGAALAMHLAAPLQKFRRVVDRFGRGELSARVGSTRKDEIGELSRAFDEMACRIETLLTAERRLLQDVSHELRSPLTRLDVAVDLASTSDDPRDLLGRIRRDVGRLTVLVDELLQLTRAEGDPSALDREVVPLDDLLRSLAEDCDLEAEAKGCRLDLRAERTFPVWGEEELLRRAIENVLRNAIRHAPEGTSIEIGLDRLADRARIVVRDHGPGVPEESLSAIFEPFFRVEGHRSRSSGGVGLGLAIARRAIALHRGGITASNAGPGLAVAIELPIARATDEQI